eukprot:9498709-Pyramimonas_sp.AAC.1
MGCFWRLLGSPTWAVSGPSLAILSSPGGPPGDISEPSWTVVGASLGPPEALLDCLERILGG